MKIRDKLDGNRINGMNSKTFSSPEDYLDKEKLSEFDSAVRKFTELELSFSESELKCLMEGNL